MLTYTITLVNSGTENRSVTMTDPIPEHTTYVTGSVGASPQIGTLSDAGDIRWAGTLPGGEDIRVTFSVRVDRDLEGTHTVTNVATIESGPDRIARSAETIINARQVFLPLAIR
jgi:uncharacterized repeat protein (TIGR01451 family)